MIILEDTSQKHDHTTQLATYNTPVSINRYNLLAHEEGCRRNSATNRSHVKQSEYDGQVNKIDGGNKKPHNIVILGDRHARGCASEVQHNLDSNFETQGMVKPGADIKEIITPLTTTTMKPSKKDVVVIWEGQCNLPNKNVCANPQKHQCNSNGSAV